MGGVIFTMNFFLEAEACLNRKGGRVWEFFPFGNFALERFFFKSRTAENEVCCERLNSFYCCIMASVTPFCLCPCEARPACWALCSVGQGQGRPRSSRAQARSRAGLASARSVRHGVQQAPNAPSGGSNRGMESTNLFSVGAVVDGKASIPFRTTIHLGNLQVTDFRGRLSLLRYLCVCVCYRDIFPLFLSYF